MVQTYTRFTPEQTPKPVLKLIILTIVISLTSAFWESLLSPFFDLPPLQSLLALSWWGISHLFLWQFVTSLFVLNSYGAGVTFMYLIILFFTMYILWIIGTTVYEYAGRRQFLQLYFLSGIAAGVVGILMQVFLRYNTEFAGPTPCILALFTVWCLLHPENELLLFFFLPVKSKWLLVGVVGAILLVGIAQLDFLNLSYYLTGIIVGYLYSNIVWEIETPFSFLHPLDRKLIGLGVRIRQKKALKAKPDSSKIVHLFTGKPPLDDEAFIDAMLSKISSEGPDSLTPAEKKRMDSIANKKQKN